MYSAVVDRVITQAEALGLVVEVEDRSDAVLQSVTVSISRPRVVEPQNMLDVAHNGEVVTVHAVRTFNTGKWTHSARFYSYADFRGSKRSLRSVKYRLEGMAS